MKKFRTTIYWIATLWLSLGMMATGISQILELNGQGGSDMMTHLGFPLYLLPLLGILKVLGVVAILLPRLPLVKEWAYAGFALLMLGAIYSHLAAKDPIVETLPGLLLLSLAVVSWYLRPASKRLLQSSNFQTEKITRHA